MQQEMYTEEEIFNKFIELLSERYGITNPKRSFSEILTEHLYTEEEVYVLCRNAFRNGMCIDSATTEIGKSFNDWFTITKKK